MSLPEGWAGLAVGFGDDRRECRLFFLECSEGDDGCLLRACSRALFLARAASWRALAFSRAVRTGFDGLSRGFSRGFSGDFGAGGDGVGIGVEVGTRGGRAEMRFWGGAAVGGTWGFSGTEDFLLRYSRRDIVERAAARETGSDWTEICRGWGGKLEKL
mgnify:CR=1 FL=1